MTSNFSANKKDVVQHPYQFDLIDMLERNGHRVTILTHAKEDTHEKIREDLDIIWFPWRRVPGRLIDIKFFTFKNISSLLSLFYNGSKHARKVIRQKNINLVICLSILPSGLYAYINAAFASVKVPYVLWSLGSDINKYRNNYFVRNLLKRMIRRAGYVFADGFDLCRTIHGMTGINCVFLPTFRGINVHSALRTDRADDCVSFLYVGRHSKVKGIDLLVDAIAQLEKANHQLKYSVTIVGEGELTPQLMSLVNKENLSHKVTFTGKVPDDDLFSLYEQADCVVIPSRSESIPVVFSEALQFEKHLIVTDVGDMGDLGKKYGVARVVEKENAEAIAGAMREFMEKPFLIDPEKREALLSLLMLEKSSQKILSVFSMLGAK